MDHWLHQCVRVVDKIFVKIEDIVNIIDHEKQNELDLSHLPSLCKIFIDLIELLVSFFVWEGFLKLYNHCVLPIVSWIRWLIRKRTEIRLLFISKTCLRWWLGIWWTKSFLGKMFAFTTGWLPLIPILLLLKFVWKNLLINLLSWWLLMGQFHGNQQLLSITIG